MVVAKNRNMHKYKKTNLVLVLTILIIILFQGFAKAEIIKWTNCKTIEDLSVKVKIAFKTQSFSCIILQQLRSGDLNIFSSLP